MKNIKFIILSGVLLGMAFLNGCNSESDENYPVTIRFEHESAVDSVYDHDTYVLKGQIEAEGPIQRVQFYRSFPFNGGQDEVEMAATEITNIADGTCSFSVNVPDITYQTMIKVAVTQGNGHQDFANFTINSGRISNIKTLSNKWTGGWESPNYGSFFSIANNSTYGMSIEWQRPELISECDFYFGDFAVGSIDLDYPKFAEEAQFPDMGTRFASTNFTSAEFDAMRDDDKFKSLSDPTLQSIGFEAGDVILFKTKNGKKGLLKIISLNSQEDYNFDVKIQK